MTNTLIAGLIALCLKWPSPDECPNSSTEAIH
jgi:hypothetical protein